MVRIYDLLAQTDSSPVVALNRAVALSFAVDPEAGLAAIEPLREDLDNYVYLHSARAELLRRTGDIDGARDSYRKALTCDPPLVQQRFLEHQLKTVARRKS